MNFESKREFWVIVDMLCDNFPTVLYHARSPRKLWTHLANAIFVLRTGNGKKIRVRGLPGCSLSRCHAACLSWQCGRGDYWHWRRTYCFGSKFTLMPIEHVEAVRGFYDRIGEGCSRDQYGTRQYTTVPYTTPHYSTGQCSTVQNSTVWCTVRTTCCAVQYTALHYITLHSTPLHTYTHHHTHHYKHTHTTIHIHTHHYTHTHTHTPLHTYAHHYTHTYTTTHHYTHTHATTHIHTYTHAHIHTWLRTYTHTHTHTRHYTHTHIRTYTHITTHIHTYTHTYIHPHLHTCAHANVHTNIQTYMTGRDITVQYATVHCLLIYLSIYLSWIMWYSIQDTFACKREIWMAWQPEMLAAHNTKSENIAKESPCSWGYVLWGLVKCPCNRFPPFTWQEASALW